MSNPPGPCRAKAFGLIWQSDIDLEHFAGIGASASVADVTITKTTTLAERTATHLINRGFVYADGFRFVWGDIVTIDVFDGETVKYLPGPGWRGQLPWPFYSTVTSLLLAWRGHLPFHASAIAIDGRGLMICGKSGAGKSSLTAALVAQGATLLSDDLTLVIPSASASQFQIAAGRPGIRLFPNTANWLFPSKGRSDPSDPRGKMMVEPHTEFGCDHTPLSKIVTLGGSNMLSPIDRFLTLQRYLFRPRWLSALPDFLTKQIAVRDISALIEFHARPELGIFDRNSLLATADSIAEGISHPSSTNAQISVPG